MVWDAGLDKFDGFLGVERGELVQFGERFNNVLIADQRKRGRFVLGVFSIPIVGVRQAQEVIEAVAGR